MTELWLRNRVNWRSDAAESVGQLFANLDVPPHHVVGGQEGARATWETIQQLVNNNGRTGNPSDR